MAIFNSYVSLPEGTPKCQIIVPCHGGSLSIVPIIVPGGMIWKPQAMIARMDPGVKYVTISR